jgi:predicted MPP superfamily phosphohydrolase
VPSRRQFLLGCLSAGALATPVGWYGTVYEPNDIEVVRRSVSIRNLPSKLSGLTAVQISDLHVRTIADVHLRMADMVRQLKPDLVLVTGDLVDQASAVGDVVELLKSFQPPRGVWVVPGNWDHTADAVDAMTSALVSTGVTLLVNDSAQLDEGLWIIGVDDPASWLDHVPEAARHVPAGAARIMLAHSPDIADRINNVPVDLIVVGHTHGGQINLPIVSGAWLHHGLSAKYIHGMYQLEGARMYVNRGIGTTTLPVRIGARPEITHFTFHGA